MFNANETKGCGFKSEVTRMGSFNVLCVTKRTSDPRGSTLFHQASPDPKAEVDQVVYTSPVLTISNTVVRFNGKTYDLGYVRAGLCGQCLVLGIKSEKPTDGFDEWELYTDTPNPAESEGVTSEMLRQSAAHHIRGS